MPFLAPVFAGITAFASTALGSIVINAGLALGASLLSGILFPPAQPNAPAPSGMRLSVTMGEIIPLSFPVGYCVTAGTRKYAMSWGNSGEVPNAYRTEVVQISDMLLPGLAEFWAFKQKCTILWGDTPTAQGYPVQEFRVDGVDHMWVKFRTGAEVTADTFMVDTFGTHAQYPWTSAFIGREAPHAIVTMLFNRELFNSDPTFLFVPTPMKFYDLRKDSTNGGSGAHRWNDQTTWESTVNPVVIIYNIVRGIYRPDGTWVYGGRNLPAQRLPASSWMAAANECDAPRDLDGGGTEPQFRCGIEINVNVEPLTMIEELMRACSARMSEIGGIFEILVGSPGAAVYSFTDANIMISRGQKYSSFPGLASTHNAIEADYIEPSEMWIRRAAPARFNATYEAQDGGRRLATGVSLLAVPFGVQAQQLMRTLIEDDRKWRTHWITLPPDAWILTGTCVVNWSSERNGYVNKKFLVVSATGEPGMCQSVVLREIDPTDYSWSTDDQLPNPVANLVIVRTPPQEVTGFSVSPAIVYDEFGVARRPAIDGEYDGNMPDIRAIHVLVRHTVTQVYEFEGEIPFNVPYTFRLVGNWLLPNTSYEVAIKYVPFTGRPTEFTEFQEVTTPNVLFGPGDFYPINIGQLNADVKAIIDRTANSVREVKLALNRANVMLNNFSSRDEFVNQKTRRELVAAIAGNTAAWSEEINVLAAADAVLASRIETVELTIPTLATLTITDTLAGSIVTTNGNVTALGARVTSIETTLPGLATVTALNALTSTVTSQGGQISVQASAITALEGVVGYESGSATFRLDMSYTPEAGWTNGFALQARVNSGSVWRNIGFYGEVTGSLGRLIMDADQIIIRAGGGIAALFAAGTTFIDNARINNLQAGNIGAGQIVAGKLAAGSINVSNLFVDDVVITQVIADNAVSGNATYTMASPFGYSGGGSGFTYESTAWSFSVTPNRAGRMVLMLTGLVGVNGSGGYGSMIIRLKQAGSTVKTRDVFYDELAYPNSNQDGTFTIFYTFTAPNTSPITFDLTMQGKSGAPNNFCSMWVAEAVQISLAK